MGKRGNTAYERDTREKMRNKCTNELDFGIDGVKSIGLGCQKILGHAGEHSHHTKAETCYHKIEFTIYWEDKE